MRVDQFRQMLLDSGMPDNEQTRVVVDLHEAKTNLPSLVDRAAGGEEILIAKSGRPVARLAPLEDRKSPRIAGQGRGQWGISSDFDAPLPDDLLEAFDSVAD